MSVFVMYLYVFVCGMCIIEVEWVKGIEFFIVIGYIIDDKWQEFILLLDILGVLMLMVVMNYSKLLEVIEVMVFGFFYVEGVLVFENGVDIVVGVLGELLFVNCMVCGLDGWLIVGVIVDIWQVDDDGFYDVQIEGLDCYCVCGMLCIDEEGCFWFKFVLLVVYLILMDGLVGVMLVVIGWYLWWLVYVYFLICVVGYEMLMMYVFCVGDFYLDFDIVFGVCVLLLVEFVLYVVEGGQGFYYMLDFDFVLVLQKG